MGHAKSLPCHIPKIVSTLLDGHAICPVLHQEPNAKARVAKVLGLTEHLANPDSVFGATLRPGPFLAAHLSRKEEEEARKEPRNRRRSHFPTFLSRTALRAANPRCRRQAERAPPRPMSVRRTDGRTDGRVKKGSQAD